MLCIHVEMFDKLICECLRVLSDTGETDPASLPSTLWGSASPGDEGTFSDRRGWKKKLGMARSASWSSSDPVYAPGTTCSALLPALEKGLPLRRLSVSNNAKDKVSKPGARDQFQARPAIYQLPVFQFSIASTLRRRWEKKRSFLHWPAKTPNTDHQTIL